MKTDKAGSILPVKTMTVQEFREFGFLQELNRRFLHPMGIALGVVIEEDGTNRWGDIADCRDDPVGCTFGDLAHVEDIRKADRVSALEKSKRQDRWQELGFLIQPVGTGYSGADEEVETEDCADR
jgi:hypothetical protein